MYKKVQCIAHCLYTATNNVWDSNAGTWKSEYNGRGVAKQVDIEERIKILGLTTKEDIERQTPLIEHAIDIEKRIALVEVAIKLAHEKAEAGTDVLKVFALPECFLQGKDGAYPMESVAYAVEKLQELVAHKSWSDWVFTFGTVNGVYDIGKTQEIVNLSPVVKGGFGNMKEAPANTVVIQKAKYCLELVKADEIQGGGLTDKVRFGTTQNEERAAMLLRHVLKKEQQAKVEEVFFKNAGVAVKRWPELKKQVENGLGNFGDAAIVREIRSYQMPGELAWGFDWLPVAKALVMAAARPLTKISAINARQLANFTQVVRALVDKNNATKVETVLKQADFPLGRWATMQERLTASLNDDRLLGQILNSQQPIAPISRALWDRDWVGATKKLLKLYVTQFKQVDIGSGPRIDEKEIDVLLSPVERGGFSPDDYRFSFDSVIGPSNKKLVFGLEICADHGEGRLKSALASAKQPPDTVDIQLIVSAGMTIGEAAIAVRPGGYLFNCDGYTLGSGRETGFSGTVDKVEFTDPAATENEVCSPHSEVRRHDSQDKCLMLRFPLATALADGIFAKGAGNLHVYGAGAL